MVYMQTNFIWQSCINDKNYIESYYLVLKYNEDKIKYQIMKYRIIEKEYAVFFSAQFKKNYEHFEYIAN